MSIASGFFQCSIQVLRLASTEREEIIMINRLLRDDPAKGLTAIKEPATFKDVKEAWADKSMWGLYFLGLIR